MADDFNPYQQWFQIPPQEQPPNRYRLLGLPAFEADQAKIEAAVEARVSFLHDVSTGVRSRDSQRLLNEVAAARLCLTDPAKKAAYDAQLITGVPAQNELEFTEIQIETALAQVRKPKKAARSPAIRKVESKNKKRSPFPWVIAAASVGLGGLFLGALLLTSPSRSSSSVPASANDDPRRAALEKLKSAAAKKREEDEKRRERQSSFASMANEPKLSRSPMNSARAAKSPPSPSKSVPGSYVIKEAKFARFDLSGASEVRSFDQVKMLVGDGLANQITWSPSLPSELNYYVQFPINSQKWNSFAVEFVPLGDGQVTLQLKGFHERDAESNLYKQEVFWDALAMEGAEMINGGFEDGGLTVAGWTSSIPQDIAFATPLAAEGQRVVRTWHNKTLSLAFRVKANQRVILRGQARAVEVLSQPGN